MEHTLVLVLLLAVLLTSPRSVSHYVPWVGVLGIGLALVKPGYSLDLPWPVISAVVLAPVLWHMGVHLATVPWTFAWQSWLVPILSAVAIIAVLHLGGRVPLAGAVLLGFLLAGLLWQIRERRVGSTDLWILGSLALLLLLTEVAATPEAFRRFVGNMFSGIGLGLWLGYAGAKAAFRLASPRHRILWCTALAYLAYAVSVALGASPVATVAMAGLAAAAVGYNSGIWSTADDLPVLSGHPLLFLLLAATWLLLTWAAHVTVSARHLTAIGLNVALAGAGLLAARWLPPAWTARPGIRHRFRPGREVRVLLLMLGMVFLWPQELVVEPWLAVALLPALLLLVALRVPIDAAFALLGKEMRFPEETRQEVVILGIDRQERDKHEKEEAQSMYDEYGASGAQLLDALDSELELSAFCPECEEQIFLDRLVTPGQRLVCPYCLADLEVCRTDPLLLDSLFYALDEGRNGHGATSA